MSSQVPTTSPLARRWIGPTGCAAQEERSHALTGILPAVLILYASLLPGEVRVLAGDLVLYAPRLVAFACLPWLWAKIASGRVRLGWLDALVVFAGVWMIGSFIEIYGLGDGIVRGGALALDVVLPYLIVRASISNLSDLRRVLVIFAPGFFLASLTLPMEAFARTPLVHPLFAQIFGPLSAYEDGQAVAARSFGDVRFGLLRALGPFPHPILAGLALGTIGVFYLSSGVRGWPRILGSIGALFVFFTLSSAAFLALLLGAILTGYDRLQRRVSFLNWKRFVIPGAALLIIIELLSTNGVAGVVQRLSLNPQTAYYRRLIWRYGVQSVEDNPLFGIGFQGYQRAAWMGQSVDNHWLLLAIRHGIAVPIALLIVVVVTVIRLANRAGAERHEVDRATLAALSYTLFTAALLAGTVALFGGAQGWFMALLATGVSLSLVKPQTTQPGQRPPTHPLFRTRAPAR